jgi:NADH:ubiquinone oxidoreductase subunit 3 (subunit A)
MVSEFGLLFVYLIVSLFLSLILVGATMLLVERTMDIEKISAYECGFHPFEDTRAKFDVRFYLVAILFIIFDLEITFLFPWSLVIDYLGVTGYLSMCFFLFILLIGFFYEWNKGALEWE